MSRIVTGIQSTGNIHLGNYIGAMRPFVELQNSHECFVFVADLHALNGVHDPKVLQENVMVIAKAYLAVGLDPEKVTIFRQSAVQEHAELAVILAPFTSHGLLERAHAYKDAVAKGKPVNAGLFYYPVLMAADILLYKPELVPVGADQQQHLEMTREIAERFNHVYGETFPLPKAHLMGSEEHILKGLDGRKMSKSYDNVIGIFDAPDIIRQKVARIVTDSKRPEEPKDPATDTLFSIYRHVASPEAVAELYERYTQGGIGYKEAKDLLAEAVIAYVAPMQAKKAELDQDEDGVRAILENGAMRARAVAEQTVREVKEKIGLLP
ncbi:MAG TPA: tryptophan--tRNA ligase [Verrucomicrobiae bacterium]|nr:tryptophan--tRNA ligase [Verrucomicrobiae bacterium]